MFQERIIKIQSLIADKNLDALLITNFYNIQYLSGFTGVTQAAREAIMVVTKSNVYILVQAMCFSNELMQRLKNKTIITQILTPQNPLLFHIQSITQKEHIASWGYESEDLCMNEFEKLSQGLATAKWVSTLHLIQQSRQIKSNEEIELIKRSCAIADEVLQSVLPSIRIGMYENEIKNRIILETLHRGVETAFEPIVAVGNHSALPHYKVGEDNKIVSQGNVVLIDMGVRYKGYCSDITRTVFFGKPKNEFINIYSQLLEIQTETIEKISTISLLKEVDAYCRKRVEDMHFGNFPHSTGHGVGLEIHEYPKISIHSENYVQENQVFTIEPGVYKEQEWGLRIEDTVLVGKDNKPEILTTFPKKLLTL